MSDLGAPTDFGEFRASFLAEAEEHLQVIEHGALDVEAELGREAPDPTRLQELFRAVHTIKGLAAMLEFEPIVDLCHRLEGVLRALERRELLFVAATVDALIEGTEALAGLIDDVRASRELAVDAALLRRLDELAELAGPPAGSPPAASTPGPARGSGRRSYEVRFAPTAETAARGLSITSVREALARVGEVVAVRPEVPTDGSDGVAFVLVVASDESVAALAAAAQLEPASVRALDEGGRGGAGRPPADRRSSVVRVDIARLDELMRLVGEMVIGRSSVARAVAAIEPSVGREALFALQEASLRMERQLREMREAVMRVRMVPIREVFGRMPLVVRDTARAAAKEARIELVGEETEVDKMLVDRLADPLVHLVRNAVDHGIEAAEQRRARGKPAAGLVRLVARQEGDRVVVEVGDDGGGVDRGRIAARAAALGLDAGDLASSDEAVLRLLCQPGFSTREQASRTSGRGVGMDVVRQRIREMNGSLELHSQPGAGSTFSLRLPLTLAIVEALTADCAGQRFAVPVASVEEVAEIEPAAVVRSEGSEMLHHRGAVLPILRLRDALGLADAAPGRERGHALIADVGGTRWAIGVDRLVGQQGVVVKPLGDELVRTPGVVGATDLGDGELVLVLDVPELVRARRERRLVAAGPGRRDG